MFHAITVLACKGENESVIGDDGQVSLGNTVMKGSVVKIHKLDNGRVSAGLAGSTVDVFNFFDMLENLLRSSRGGLLKTATDLSREWRRGKYLRGLEAMILVPNRKHIFLLSDTGDVLEPENNQITVVGSGGNYALSAARALEKHTQSLGEEEPAKSSLQIAGEIYVYTDTNIKTYAIEDEE